jgi:hypothetical protein
MITVIPIKLPLQASFLLSHRVTIPKVQFPIPHKKDNQSEYYQAGYFDFELNQKDLDTEYLYQNSPDNLGIFSGLLA